MDYGRIKKYYEELYEGESHLAFPYDLQRYQAWLKEIAPQRSLPCKALDIGCGVGYACEQLAKKGFEVWGTDISETALAMARSKLPQSHFEVSQESGELKYANEIFDLILCLGVLEHIKPQKKVIQESYRTLKNGGQAIFMVPNSLNPYFWLGGTGQIQEVPLNFWQWKKMFTDAGYQIEKVSRDPGPSWNSQLSMSKKFKLLLQKTINTLPVQITYQFIFWLRK